jgi:predicted chitinase
MADFIDVNILILDSNNKKFKGFPFKGKFSNETKQKQKICDENGICKLTLKVGTTYQISVLKPDDSYQEKLVINTTENLNNTTQKIVLDDPINSYLASIILTAKDISTPPQVVPKAQIQISYMGKTSIRDMNDLGVLKLRILIGEPLQYQLVDPLSKKPMQGTHLDETVAKKMKNAVTVVQPSIRADSSLEPDKPDTTTPETPKSDMTITMAQMKKMWPAVKNTEKMQVIINELNSGLKNYKLDTRLRQAHFFAQVYAESGYLFRLREDIASYTENNLLKNMGYYMKNPKEAKIDAAIKDKTLKEKTICNKAYMDVNRPKNRALGNVKEGDGYKFIGRGMKQLTGRYNYTQFNKIYKKAWPDEELDFVENPELVEQPKYAARTALVYWLANKLYDKADAGATHTVVDGITKGVNAGATPDMLKQRRSFFDTAKAIFKDTEVKK